jgi:hypothetical protein
MFLLKFTLLSSETINACVLQTRADVVLSVSYYHVSVQSSANKERFKGEMLH